jgi:RHS repeat-associated protein
MPFGFTEQWQDPNDLLFLRARYYNPALGVFLSLDPLEGGVGNVRTLNRYGYVQANPANLVDPSGLVGEMPGQ